MRLDNGLIHRAETCGLKNSLYYSKLCASENTVILKTTLLSYLPLLHSVN